jgi:pseudouridine-5'-monophosphatase
MRLGHPVTHALFDLDGVLLDTEGLYTAAAQEIVGRYGKVFDWSIKQHTMGRDAKLGAKILLDHLDVPLTPEEYLREREPILERLFQTVNAITNAERFVGLLHSRRIPMAVATSSERRLAQLKMRDHSWFTRFDAIVCGDDPRVLEKKPAPDIFLAAASDLRAAPKSCVVFEDSPAGVEAARAAGMQVVALPDPAVDERLFRDADIVARGYFEISPEDFGW